MTDIKKAVTEGFPQNEDVARMLYWMGNDYVETITRELREGLLKQDAGSQLISVHCSEEPAFQTAFKLKPETECTGVATRMEATFPVQVVVLDSRQRRWRLYMNLEYRATGLDVPASSQVKCDFNILRSEPA